MNFFLSSTGSSLESESSACYFFTDWEGAFEGALEGTADGTFEGTADGAFEGAFDGNFEPCDFASGSLDKFSWFNCAEKGINYLKDLYLLLP